MGRGGSSEGAAALRGVDAGLWVFEGRGRADLAGGGGIVSVLEYEQPRRRSFSMVWGVVSLLLLAVVIFGVGKQLAWDFKELRAQQIHVEVSWVYLAAGIVCL